MRFGILVSRFRILLGTMGQRLKLSGTLLLHVWWCTTRTAQTAQQAKDTPRQSRQGTHPTNDVAALQNEQVVFVPDDNYGNPSRKAKHQRELPKDYFNDMEALAGQEDRI